MILHSFGERLLARTLMIDCDVGSPLWFPNPHPFIYLLSLVWAASSCRGKMRVIIGVAVSSSSAAATGTFNHSQLPHQPTLRLTPLTAENLALTKLNPPLPSPAAARSSKLFGRTQINISEEPQVGTEPGSFLCFVNVKNLLDVPVAKVLGLESRGQTGCSWVRRPSRLRLTRLIEEHIV